MRSELVIRRCGRGGHSAAEHLIAALRCLYRRVEEDGLIHLWKRSEQIREDLAQRIQSDQHARFVDWLLDNVVMAGIEATDRDSGFRIFESMNDRELDSPRST